MNKRVRIMTKNPYLAQKLRLYLEEMPDVTLTEQDEADIFFVDAGERFAFPGARVISVGKARAELAVPFGQAELADIFSDRKGDCELTVGDKCAYLRGERIRLTEIEHSLLSALLSKKGEFITREELLDSVWQSEKSEGVLNVYIHYLREKLETGGEKIIISSRKQGYKINEKYLGEEATVC